MHFLKNVSIKHKLTWIIMITTGVALLIACATFALYEFSQVRSAMVRELVSLADIVGTNSAAPLEFNDSVAGKETLDALMAEARIIAAKIYNKKGELFTSYQSQEIDKRHEKEIFLTDGEVWDRGHLSVFKPLVIGNERIGTIYIHSHLRGPGEHLKSYGIIVGLVLLGSSLVAFLLSLWLQKMVSQPVLHLAETVDRESRAGLGIDLARAHRPDLILMDIHMPEMDGITAMKILRTHKETHDIPIIAVSANAMESDIEKGLKSGFKAYIAKPFNIQKLFIEIDRFLQPEKSPLGEATK